MRPSSAGPIKPPVADMLATPEIALPPSRPAVENRIGKIAAWPSPTTAIATKASGTEGSSTVTSSKTAPSSVPTRTSRRGPKRCALWSVSMRPANIAALKQTRLSEAVLALAPITLCKTSGAQPSTPLAVMEPMAPSAPSAITSLDGM